MARWQHAGYGRTLGGAILSEGIATYYEVKTSGWLSPWAQAVLTKQAIEAAASEWDKPAYNHADWFFQGQYGRWIGYGIGYQLATKLFASGFDLSKSLTITSDDAKYLLKHL